MKDDFLTIPTAPIYEINSQLICRNKITGKILKPRVRSKRTHYYYNIYLGNPKHAVTRSARTLRANDLAAVTVSSFEPILSLNGKYEINNRGVVRNSRTKHIVKPQRRSVGLFNDKNVRIRISVAELLWEVHGHKIPSYSSKPIHCTLENKHGKHFFKSLKDAARFLAPKVYLTFNTVCDYLCKRKSTIYGWKISYLIGSDSFD